MRILTLLLLSGSSAWLLLCLGSAAMQTSTDNASELFRIAWPPFVLSTPVGLLLVIAAHRTERWKPLASLGRWTLGISLASLALIALAIRFP